MKKYISVILTLFLGGIIGACGSNDEEPLFEKPADERAAEAIAGLKQKLTAPANGWVMHYQPVPESGTYNVLLNFNENGGVRIRTDFGINDNEFYDQSNTFRVDNSLGLELVFESYSFFSYLFEQDGATFEAEYEFVFVNETPSGELVFTSKTDLSFTSSTIVVLEPAPDNAETLLGRALNANLETLSESLGVTSPVYRLDYTNRDLSLYLSFDTFFRTISFTYIATKSGERGEAINLTTGYEVRGNSIVLGEPLTGNFQGSEINLTSINLRELVDAPDIEACNKVLDLQQYQGNAGESNEAIALLPALLDPAGATFNNDFSLFRCPLGAIYDNGVSVGRQLVEDITNAAQLQMYYRNDTDNPFIAIGFLILNESGSATFALKDFSLASTDNRIEFDFAPDYTLYNDTTVAVNTEAMDKYLDRLTEGNETYVLKAGADRYEFFNACNGWSFIFFAE